jgi:adenylate cyclase
MLAEFGSAVDAIKSAVAIQHELKMRKAELEGHRQMAVRIRLNVGAIITDEGRRDGDGVNIAARLDGLATPCEICLSEAVHMQIKNKLDLAFFYQGEQVVKNISKPIRVYKVDLDAEAAAPSSAKEPPTKLPLPDKDSYPSLACASFNLRHVGGGDVRISG